jgi:hypothetical protein
MRMELQEKRHLMEWRLRLSAAYHLARALSQNSQQKRSAVQRCEEREPPSESHGAVRPLTISAGHYCTMMNSFVLISAQMIFS